MIAAVFRASVRSAKRLWVWHVAVVLHLVVTGVGSFVLVEQVPLALPRVAMAAVAVGIVEGALLIGWRLTQLPKNRATEFLLATPQSPWTITLAETAVTLVHFTLVQLSSLPVLVLLICDGYASPWDVIPLLCLPWSWGALTGAALIAWAYESRAVRRLGQRAVLALLTVYLLVGILAGERISDWLAAISPAARDGYVAGIRWWHTSNPFAIADQATRLPPGEAWLAVTAGVSIPLGIAVILLARAASRFASHFAEIHYGLRERAEVSVSRAIGDHPLAWWAVKRVTQYGGWINLYAAAAVGCVYALHIVAGEHWPGWMGRRVFWIFDRVMGFETLLTAIVILSAVPAAFQYGLWDASAAERCRKLELLLLTKLDCRDFERAAFAAAWRRGRGYAFVATMLICAAIIGGRWNLLQAIGFSAASLLLWTTYFAIGFRSFCRGRTASDVGLMLTLGLPFATWGLVAVGWTDWASLLPPGFVYSVATSPSAAVAVGATLAAVVAIYQISRCRRRDLSDLREWFALHHGKTA